jgi:hypothetical protein
MENETENQQPQQETLKFEFTVEQANIILQSLSEGPYRVVNPLIANIQQQAQSQMTTAMPSVDEGEGEAPLSEAQN